MRAELLQEFDLDFYFEDGADPVYKQGVVRRVLIDRYEGVNLDNIEIDEMGGTTHFVYFEAVERRRSVSVLDLPKEEQQGRIDALFHLNSSDY